MSSCLHARGHLLSPFHSVLPEPGHEMAPLIFRVGLPTTINPLKETPHSFLTGQPNLNSSWRRPSCVSLQWAKPIRIHHHIGLTLVPVHIPRQTETPFPGVRCTECLPFLFLCFVFGLFLKPDLRRNLPSLLREIFLILDFGYLFCDYSGPHPCAHHIPVLIPSLTPVRLCGPISSGHVCIRWCYRHRPESAWL